MKKMQKILCMLLALAMLLGVAAGCGQSAGEASVQSVSMICGLGSAGMTDRFAGVVSALGETNIKKDDSMTIGEIKVKAGDAVNVGDVLFTYDMSQLEIDLEDAQLSLEELKSQLETQQEEKKQAEDALDETTDDTERRRLLLDIRNYNNEMQKTNRSIAEKNRDIEKLQKNMQNSSVKAEVAGEVKSVNANGGTDNNNNPLPLISIVQTGGYRVKGYVNENNASVLSEGISVIIRSRVSDQTWQGTISSIDWNNPAQSSNNTYDSGSYLLNGQDITKCSPKQLAEVRNKELGFVFQSFNLLPKLTAVENVALPLLYGGVKKAERLERARQALETVGLSDRVDHRPDQLSGGQCQRVAIARAIVGRPKLLLADEPTGALDSASGAQVMDLFQQLHQSGSTIIMITHDQGIAQHAHTIMNIRDGVLSGGAFHE